MTFTWDLPHPTRRMPVLAENAVATSQPLAAQAGLCTLLRGGNAVDAALAAAVTLTVVEPTGSGVGGDLFALLWDGQALLGLNASGRSPQAWSPEHFAGRKEMPARGWGSVTVPGAVSGWAALSERFGKLRFPAVFEPAIGYARGGFPVAPRTAAQWAAAAGAYRGFPGFREAFLLGGRAPRAGEWFRHPALARTLEAIAESEGEAFYRGELAHRIAACAEASGGALSLADLAEHRPEWVEPLAEEYRGHCLHELPPNGQGIAALLALGILQGVDPPESSADCVHLQVEAMKIALEETHRHVADPAAMAVTPRSLLDHRLLSNRARGIRLDRARPPGAMPPSAGGTVCVAAADAAGMMICLLQSNYQGFGSGLVVQGTGISLHNRGLGFTLEPGHPNAVAGAKRPFHTIIPAFLTKAGQPLMAFGVMGGTMQPQGHVQVVTRIVDRGENPQAACDAPRWRVEGDGTVSLEAGFDPAIGEELRRRGHPVRESQPETSFGGAQLVWRLDRGYLTASDGRKDGQAVGY